MNAPARPSIEMLWQRFLDARRRSLETLTFEDGQRAGLAYRDFLAAYDPHEMDEATAERMRVQLGAER
jgi:hypothetical protein